MATANKPKAEASRSGRGVPVDPKTQYKVLKHMDGGLIPGLQITLTNKRQIKALLKAECIKKV